MALLHPLLEQQQQCQRSLCLHQAINFNFLVFIKHHYDCDSFFDETIQWKYLLHLSSVYRFKYIGEIHKY